MNNVNLYLNTYSEKPKIARFKAEIYNRNKKKRVFHCKITNKNNIET